MSLSFFIAGIKSIRKKYYVFSLIVLFFFWNCSEDNPLQTPTEFEPKIVDFVVPEVVYNASLRKHLLSVKVEDPQGVADIEIVSYVISKAEGAAPSAEGRLLDDGKNGDIIPGDGVFVAQIDGSFAQNDTGFFNVQATAVDKSGNHSDTLQKMINVMQGTENTPPEIVQVQLPTIVYVDSSYQFQISVTVFDTEGLNDIQHVLYQFFPPSYPVPTREDTLRDNGLDGDRKAGDGTFTAILSSDIIQVAADYFFRFFATDKSANRSTGKVARVNGRFLHPQNPVIFNVVAPDTVKIHATNTTEILITVDVSDPQGLSDIDFVRFRSFLPDGKESSQSPFNLSDNGTGGDAERGDGTYSLTIFLPSASATPPVQRGNFRFIFQARDKSGLLSDEIEHIMTVID
ncbi:MAG: choice-of-anchor X domain-containing protein [bacterium]